MAKADLRDSIPIIKVPLFPGRLGIDCARELLGVFEKHVHAAEGYAGSAEAIQAEAPVACGS